MGSRRRALQRKRQTTGIGWLSKGNLTLTSIHVGAALLRQDRSLPQGNRPALCGPYPTSGGALSVIAAVHVRFGLNPCNTADVMAGTAACGSLMATNTRRVVIERVAIGAIVRRVNTGLGDGALGRAGALLRIEPVSRIHCRRALRRMLQVNHYQQKALLSTRAFGTGWTNAC